MGIANTIDLLEDICGKYKDVLGESFLTSDLGKSTILRHDFLDSHLL